MKRERSRKKGQRPPNAGRPSGSPAVLPAALSSRRKWLFRLLAVVVLPLILLGGLELMLRLLGVGFDPHFFKPARIGGQDCYVANDSFGLDRKSTRLNSSHLGISYAVFCLEK